MLFEYSVALLMFVILIGNGCLTPVMEYGKGNRYEEYVIEHEISTSQAKNAALSIDYASIVTPPGCQTCTKSELHYCMGQDLINDHCCCDKRYHELLPFIPHTCYLGSKLCSTIASSCAEYNRLRECCCHKYALEKWKEKSAGVSYMNNRAYAIIFSNIVNIFVLYLFT